MNISARRGGEYGYCATALKYCAKFREMTLILLRRKRINFPVYLWLFRRGPVDYTGTISQGAVMRISSD